MRKLGGDVVVSYGQMLTVFSPDHLLHQRQVEFLGQELVDSFESPDRAALVLQGLADRGFLAPGVKEQAEVDLSGAHDPAYLAALSRICRSLRASEAALLPISWSGRGRCGRGDHPAGVQLGEWSRDMYTSVGAGTFMAAAGSARAVVAALDRLTASSRKAAFALGRPPHHHAGHDYMGGYCYLNGVALAALMARRAGRRVAVIDVDFHHGNGTQDILYRTDVFYGSIHGDPVTTFPYFRGFADETGEGCGEGLNLNIPLPDGMTWSDYSQALACLIDRAADHGPDICIVSLGVDTFAGDPVGRFSLCSADFCRIGAALGRMNAPTLFVMEGGYAVEEIGNNVANVLSGFIDC